VTAHDVETIPCNFSAETLPPESTEQSVSIPRDSEWAGFSLEMASILAEVGA
jgi:hypothetical protein